MDRDGKNPFRGYTMDEIEKAEASSFVIVLNNDFFLYKERYSFTREIAEKLHTTLMNGFSEILENGTEKEIKEAKELIIECRILPLRIH